MYYVENLGMCTDGTFDLFVLSIMEHPLCVEDEHTKLVESVTRALFPALVTMYLAPASNTPLKCKTRHCMNVGAWCLVTIQHSLTNTKCCLLQVFRRNHFTVSEWRPP